VNNPSPEVVIIQEDQPEEFFPSTITRDRSFSMKTFVAVVITFCLALVLGWLIWGRHSTPGIPAKFTPIAHSPATNAIPPLPVRPSPPPPSNLPLPSEWQELRSARDTTLQNNPELADEYKSLLAEMDQQEKDLDAAMIKADPKVAPIVAKLEQMRKKNTVKSPPAATN
jgi:hypothetical protein